MEAGSFDNHAVRAKLASLLLCSYSRCEHQASCNFLLSVTVWHRTCKSACKLTFLLVFDDFVGPSRVVAATTQLHRCIAAWTDAANAALQAHLAVPMMVSNAIGPAVVAKHSSCTALVCSLGIIHIVSITPLLPSLLILH